MEILFRRSREHKLCVHRKTAARELGKPNAEKLEVRLATLAASANLAQFRRDFPEARCHALTGDWRGCFAVDLHGTWRLVFRPAHDPMPVTADGGIALAAVTSIEIVEVVDYHG